MHSPLIHESGFGVKNGRKERRVRTLAKPVAVNRAIYQIN